MTTIESIESRVRAARHTSSLPLIVVGLAVILVGASHLVRRDMEVAMFITPVTALALWLSMKIVAKRAGLGMGRERYGLIGLIVSLVSFISLISLFLGPSFLLGVMLFAVGWRSEDRGQWARGALLAIASPLLSFWFLQNTVYDIELAFTGWYWFTDMSVDDAVLALLGLAFVVTGIRRMRQESVELRQTP